jgi:hypothetical protein
MRGRVAMAVGDDVGRVERIGGIFSREKGLRRYIWTLRRHLCTFWARMPFDCRRMSYRSWCAGDLELVRGVDGRQNQLLDLLCMK